MAFMAGGRFTVGRGRGLAMLLLATLAALAVAIPSSAQAHVPYVAKAWGDNREGELGIGNHSGPERCNPPEEVACSVNPVAVSNLSGITGLASERGAVDGQALALLESGGVWGWGRNDEGQVGDGTTAQKDAPVAVCAVGSTAEQCQQGAHLIGIKAMSAGSLDGLAVLEAGTVAQWGSPGAGGKPTAVPVLKSGVSGVTAVAAGRRFNLALLGDGTVQAWGDNSSGELGNGTKTSSEEAVFVCAVGEKAPCATRLSGVKAIAAGESYALALLETGRVVAWGEGSFGTLGNGSEASGAVPVAVCATGAKTPCPEETQQLKEVTAIAAGERHSLGLLSNGTVVAWGFNASGQLGDGTSTGPEGCTEFKAACGKVPVAVTGLSGISAVSAGGKHSLALRKDGTVDAWGVNAYGQLGIGTSVGPEPCLTGGGACSTEPREVSKLAGIKGIAAGQASSFAFGLPVPTVTGVSPNEASQKRATKVTITGTGFEEVNSVKFGPNAATSFTVNSEGSITAIAPSGTGTVDVTVTTPAGTSVTSPADRFYYERPTVKKLSPKKGPASGGTSVTIIGTKFAGATAVKFGSNNATSVKVNSETSITAVSPAGTKGTVDVSVTTPNGTSAISKKDRFKYT